MSESKGAGGSVLEGMGLDVTSSAPTKKQPSTEERAEYKRKWDKRRASFYLPLALKERMKGAVLALAGEPEHLTLSSLAEQALARELVRLEKKYNNGKPYQARKRRELPRGPRPQEKEA